MPIERPPRPRPKYAAAFAITLALAASAGADDGFLAIPRTIDGLPTNVGLLVLGHSTSAQGGYPAKLEIALEADALGLDGRNYVVFRAITGGDGGFLWSRLSFPAGDVQRDRVRASQGVGASPSPQWCEDGAGVRWSCRRARLEEVLTGAFPIPASGGCADATVSSCRAAATMSCTFFDRALPPEQNPVTETLSPFACWQKMDYRLALVQDTTNRSWPIDDFDADGAIGDEPWPATRIAPAAQPCGGGSGVVAGAVDWSCDGAIDGDDSAREVYADWLEALADRLLEPGGVDFVFFGHKPLEKGQCNLYPEAERPTCLADHHAIRTPAEIAATPDRPFDHYFVPTVYWEQESLGALFARAALDPRVLPATPDDRLAMWNRSVACYVDGLAGADWAIAASVAGRPDDVAADDSESDGGPAPNADALGCLVSDHIHHNDAGGWQMADVWYRGLAPRLFTGVFADGFESGDLVRWNQGFAPFRSPRRAASP